MRIAQVGGTVVLPTVSGTGTVARRAPSAIDKSARIKAGAPAFYLGLPLPPADAARIRLGANANLRFPAFSNDVIVGRVIKIAQRAGGAAPVAVEVALPKDARLKVGQTAIASIVANGGGTRVLAVPPSALFDRQGTMAKVYVVDLATSHVHVRQVRLGEHSNAGIGIASGVSIGEWIALSQLDQLKDGMKIAPLGPQ